MNLDAGGVHGYRFEFNAHDLSTLQLLEHPIKHAGFGPAIHARVDGVPVAKALGQPAPLAAMLGDIQHRIQNNEIGQADVTALRGKAVFDLLELGLRDFHAVQYLLSLQNVQLALTRPSFGLALSFKEINALPQYQDRPVFSFKNRSD